MSSGSGGLVIGILAVDDDMGIGSKGGLPWGHNKWDMKFFRKMTEGEAVVMGRKTWDSLPLKPLPNRMNFVLTSSKDLQEVDTLTNDCSLPEVPEIIYIIGGAHALLHYRDYIDAMVLSKIEGSHGCDTFMPKELLEGKVLQRLEHPKRMSEGKLDVDFYVKESILGSFSAEVVKSYIESVIIEVCLGD